MSDDAAITTVGSSRAVGKKMKKDITKIHIIRVRSTHVGDMWSFMSLCPPATNDVKVF